MATPLDPEDALSGPLYLVALMLVVVPLVDFLLSVPPPRWADPQWRFSTMGLLASYTMMPVIGVALALVVSAFLRHGLVQRILVLACLTIGLALLAASLVFLQDVRRQRPSVPAANLLAFRSAWLRAMTRLLFASAAFTFLGWRTWRLRVRSLRHRTPRPVHVVSK